MRLRFNIHQGFPIIGHLFYTTWGLKLRLVRIENNDSVAVLATSLIDTQQYPIDIFNELYHDRWPIEEDYKAINAG
jgi:hypothetical protein